MFKDSFGDGLFPLSVCVQKTTPSKTMRRVVPTSFFLLLLLLPERAFFFFLFFSRVFFPSSSSVCVQSKRERGLTIKVFTTHSKEVFFFPDLHIFSLVSLTRRRRRHFARSKEEEEEEDNNNGCSLFLFLCFGRRTDGLLLFF